jgi:hypothetical protein
MEQYTKTIAACDIHSVKHFTLAMQDKGAGNDKWLHEPSYAKSDEARKPGCKKKGASRRV